MLQAVSRYAKALLPRHVARPLSSAAVDASHSVRRPRGVRMGWSKEVIGDLLPFTSELVTSRGRHMESIAVGYCSPSPPVTVTDPATNVSTTARRVDDSWLEIILPFSDQPTMRDMMVRADGQTIRYGKLFEILDALAADVAYRHIQTSKMDIHNSHISPSSLQLVVVTASVDGVRASANIDVNNDLKLQGYLTYVGKSSMEVTIDIIAGSNDGSERKIGDTQFIMVARDNATGSAAAVHGLHSMDVAQSARFESGKRRATGRKWRAATSLSIQPPQKDEVDLIHSLFLQSKSLKKEKGDFLKKLAQSNECGSAAAEAAAISEKKNFKWMGNTALKNVLLMHSQDRNIHGKIFGGFLMKQAFELAWVTSVIFLGIKNPVFISVDDIQFVKPVNIGSILEFTSTVVYSEGSKLVVLVKAFDVSVESGSREKTNMLTYVFSAPLGAPAVPAVMPKDYEEFINYLQGRRSLKSGAPEH